MRVLVTGGSGQLGSAVVRALLADRHEVRCLVLDPARLDGLEGVDVEVLAGNVTEPESLVPAMAGRDAVVHMAGIVSYLRTADARRRLAGVFVDGTRNVVDAAAAAGVGRVLITSSIAALGYLPDGEVGDEDTAWNWGPLDIPYFAAKKAAEDLVLSETRIDGVAVNPGVVFGGNDFARNGARTLLQVASGRLPGVPSGATTAACLQDVASGHALALRLGRPGQRYVLGGTTLTFQELYRRIGEVIGHPAPTRVLPPVVARAGAWVAGALGRVRGREPAVTPALVEISIRNRRYRSTRAERELGWSSHPIEQGLGECWAWIGKQTPA